MKILLIFVASILIYFNIKLYLGPDLGNQNELIESSLNQLKFLENGLKNQNFGEKSQKVFPEGYVFINALYGLSWCELIKNKDSSSSIFIKGLQEAKFAYSQLKSQKAKSTFPQTLPIKFGAFYTSWTNYLLAKINSLEKSKGSIETLDFIKNCDEINSAFIKNDFELLESYPDQIWPADNMGMIASLRIYDDNYGKKYNNTYEQIIEKLKAKNNQTYIPHSNGQTKNFPRGSSSSLMLIFLPEIDQKFAFNVFNNFKKEFLSIKIGQAGIKEFPEYISGDEDIDSGPIVWDIGFSGTIVSIGTFMRFNEINIANKISNEVETVGFPLTFNGRKKYLLGSLPIADAFILWSRLQKPIILSKKNNETPYSNNKLHFISLIVIGIFSYLIFNKNKTTES